MKKVVRLSESDIARIVNKIINEQPERDRTGDLYADINSLIDDEYNDVDYEDVANVLENILRGIKAQSHRNKKGMKPISKNDILKNFGLNEQEEESCTFVHISCLQKIYRGKVKIKKRLRVFLLVAHIVKYK